MNDGGIGGGMFAKGGKRIGLLELVSILVVNEKLVLVSAGCIRNEELPASRWTEWAHGQGVLLPSVEVPSQKDLLGKRSPDHEGNAIHALKCSEDGPQFLMRSKLQSLVEVGKLVVSDRGQKGVGILKFLVAFGPAIASQEVGKDLGPFFDLEFKETTFIDSGKWEGARRSRIEKFESLHAGAIDPNYK